MQFCQPNIMMDGGHTIHIHHYMHDMRAFSFFIYLFFHSLLSLLLPRTLTHCRYCNLPFYAGLQKFSFLRERTSIIAFLRFCGCSFCAQINQLILPSTHSPYPVCKKGNDVASSIFPSQKGLLYNLKSL